MSLIVWNDRFRLGVDIIDQQHSELFRLANELADAMKSGRGRDVLATLLTGLTGYTVSHFATEERLMREYGYPGAAEHRRQHENLRQTVAKLSEKARGGQLALTLETMQFLRDWLSEHILHSDRELAAFLAGRLKAAPARA